MKNPAAAQPDFCWLILAASILAAATRSSISKQWSSIGLAAECFFVHLAFTKQTRWNLK
jgi:hypothetical protein